MTNPFEILGIPENSGELSIKKRFRELLFQYHPDAGNDSNVEKTKIIIEALKEALIRVKNKDKKIENTFNKILKIDIFVEPQTDDDIYKIVYQLLLNIEKYYYSHLEILEKILFFLDRIKDRIENKNLNEILNSLSLFFLFRIENIKNKKIYSFNIERYKLLFFDYIKNIFTSRDYISYRMTINTNYNNIIEKSINLIKNESDNDIANEIVGFLMIIVLFQEEELYNNIFKFFVHK